MSSAVQGGGALRGLRGLLRRLALLVAGSFLLQAACNNAIKLEHFLQGAGPSFTVLSTFGQLIAVSPSRAAHYLAVRLDPPATDVLTPSSGEVSFAAALDGLTNCLILTPKLRDDDDATPLGDLGPGLAKPDKLRIALCNLDTAAPSPLEAAVHKLYEEAEADDPAAETTEFFTEAVDLDDRTVEVWAAPEAAFPDPPPDGELRKWSRLGPASAGVLHVGAYAEDDDGRKTYLNPAPYLAKIPLAPPPAALRPATLAEIRLESAADEAFTTSVRPYSFDLGTGAMNPNEPLGGFSRVFFRLTTNSDDGGTTAVAVPHEISYELREMPAGTVRSHGRFFLNAFATSDTVALADLAENIGDALYRTPGAGAPESNPAAGTEVLWLQLPMNRSIVGPATAAPLVNVGDLGFDQSLALEVEDAAVRRYPPGDYELEIVLASGFGGAATDTKTLRFQVVGAPTLQLTAAHAADMDEEIPGAPVRLNDDNDNANTYPDPSVVAGKNPLEPWFDLEETAVVAGEDDLMQLTLDVVPHSLTGNAVLTVPSGGHRIKLWNTAAKGAAGDLVAVPAGGLNVPIADLPKTFWVEGVETGDAELHLEYTNGPLSVDDTIDVHVVRLLETQTWPDGTTTRRVINRYATDVDFQVDGGTAGFTYGWDLNGDGDRATDPFEIGLASQLRSVRYDTIETAASVRLDRIAANRRQTYDVTVELTGGLVLRKTIRVALDSHQGTALVGVAVADRQVEIGGLTAVPLMSFDPTPPGGAGVTFSQAWHVATYAITLNVNAGNRLQYADAVHAWNAFTTHNGYSPGLAAAARRVHIVMINRSVYTGAQTQEDAIASINHENLHVAQIAAIRDNLPAGNVWRLLHDQFAGGLEMNGYEDFTEGECHLSEVGDATVGWYHLIDGGQSDLPISASRYNAAIGVLAGLPAGATFTAAETLLRDLYTALPFDEMKRTDYDQTVRPPP